MRKWFVERWKSLSRRKGREYASTAWGYGMAKMKGGYPWWKHPVFPLVPQWELRAGDERSAWTFGFSWLWFRAWALEAFSLEVAIEVEATGLNVKAIIGWLRIVVRVLPLPSGWLDRLHRKRNRWVTP